MELRALCTRSRVACHHEHAYHDRYELCGAWLSGGVAAAAAGASSLDLPLPDNPFLVTTVNCGRRSCCPIIMSVDGCVVPCDATVNTSNACQWRMASAALSCFPCDKQVST